MRILLIGGTGAMGKPLSYYLNTPDNQIFVTTRTHKENEGSITYIQGNAHDEVFINSILQKQWDCIIDFMVYTTIEFSNRLEKFLSATHQYIYLSSARVYANSVEPLVESSSRLLDVCENTEYFKTDEYALKKARQENLLFQSKSKNWTIIRPYITYNENRFQLGVLEKEEWLYLALNENLILFSNDIKNKITTMTYGNDVALIIKKLIGNTKSFGEAFHITGNENCSMEWDKILNIYKNKLEQYNIKPKIMYQDLSYRLNDNNTKYQVLYDRYYNRVFDNSKILSVIGNYDFKSINEGLSESLDMFMKNPKFNDIPYMNLIKSIKNTDIKIQMKNIKGLRNRLSYIFNV